MTDSTPEPGEQVDLMLGVPGPAEPMPIDEAEREEATLINEEEGDDGHEEA